MLLYEIMNSESRPQRRENGLLYLFSLICATESPVRANALAVPKYSNLKKESYEYLLTSLYSPRNPNVSLRPHLRNFKICET